MNLLPLKQRLDVYVVMCVCVPCCTFQTSAGKNMKPIHPALYGHTHANTHPTPPKKKSIYAHKTPEIIHIYVHTQTHIPLWIIQSQLKFMEVFSDKIINYSPSPPLLPWSRLSSPMKLCLIIRVQYYLSQIQRHINVSHIAITLMIDRFQINGSSSSRQLKKCGSLGRPLPLIGVNSAC